MRCHICDYEPFARSDFHRGLANRHNRVKVSIDHLTKKPICEDCRTMSKIYYIEEGEIELLEPEEETLGMDRYS